MALRLRKQCRVFKIGGHFELHKFPTLLLMGPQGFLVSGEKGYLFSGSWAALIFILGEQAHSFGDLGSPAKRLKKSPKTLSFHLHVVLLSCK